MINKQNKKKKAKNPNYSSTKDSAQFTQLQNQVDEVRDVMTNNIDKILKRGDRLEDLVDKTSELETTVSRSIILNHLIIITKNKITSF